MVKNLRIVLLIVLIVGPIIFYKALNKRDNRNMADLSFIFEKSGSRRPLIALIFDDLGESLSDLREIYSLDTPLTISIIPNLKFSKNIAHIGSRCGFSVFIHLPLQPEEKDIYRTNKYKFISSDLSKKEIQFLLRKYLNSIRIAIGINNHMGSGATRDSSLMRIVLREIKNRGLIFVDSRTSTESVAYKIAREEGLVCGYNQGFLDSSDDIVEMGKRMDELISKAKEKGKIIIIAHPKKNTINFLKRKLPALKKKVEFITIKDYFNL